MAWVSLIIAGIFESVWAMSMKLSLGFTKPIPSIVTIIAMLISFALLAYAMKTLPLGTAYVIWTGLGAIGAFVIGIFFFGEATSFWRFFAALLIISGLLLMKFTSPN